MKTVNRMNCTPELVSVLLRDGTVYHGTMFKKRGYSIALKNATIYFTDNTVAYVPLATLHVANMQHIKSIPFK